MGSRAGPPTRESSSLRAGAERFALAILAALAVAAVAIFALRRGPRDDGARAPVCDEASANGPVLVIRRVDAGDAVVGASDEAAPARDERAMALAITSLSPTTTARLREALDELAMRLDVKANPLVEELDDTAPDGALRDVVAAVRPTLTAAESLTAGRWTSDDDGFDVRAMRACPCDARVRCFAPWERAPTDDVERRARFFAWPIAAAARLRVAEGGVEGAERAAVTLRERAASRDSRIALALTARTLVARADDAGSRAVREDAARVVERLARAGRRSELLDRVAAAPSEGVSLVPWLVLADDEVLVVPRLGALVDLVAFTREIDLALAAGAPTTRVAWMVRPAPLD